MVKNRTVIIKRKADKGLIVLSAVTALLLMFVIWLLFFATISDVLFILDVLGVV